MEQKAALMDLSLCTASDNPVGLGVKFDNVVYLTDSMSGAVHVISQVTNTATFLKAIGDLYKAFSVHAKGKPFEILSPLNLPWDWSETVANI